LLGPFECPGDWLQVGELDGVTVRLVTGADVGVDESTKVGMVVLDTGMYVGVTGKDESGTADGDGDSLMTT
jgi:hypothetical protein